MDIKNFFGNLFDTAKPPIKSLDNVGDGMSKPVDISNYYPSYTPHIKRRFYTGEKTPGELGAAIDYLPDYTRLRIYSWQSYLESEITQTVINKYITWVVGNGLKLQAEPNAYVLQQENVTLSKEFRKSVDERFKVWSKSIHADHSKMLSLNVIGNEAVKHAKIGGDCLVVFRVTENNLVTSQLIDGEHVMTPFYGNKEIKEAKARGNKIVHGIEISPTGEHVNYFVLGSDNKIYTVPRIGSNSQRVMAVMVYGSRYRIDEVRGMPLISAVLESLRKLDRYKEATVGSAEERQKIAFSVEHGDKSTGENMMMAKLVQAKSVGMPEAPETKSEDAREVAATKIATTTGKQVFNMPVDSQLKLLESKNELYFKEFYDTNFNAICSALQIPPEVARSMYNSNYSASRAAIKDWEHSLNVIRNNFSDQYYQSYYNLWLDMQVLTGKISAPGYIMAIRSENIMVIEAYRNARWIGANVPHIDPVKEVIAERKKLGDDTTPLGTYDQAAENLGTGDWSQNMETVKEERKTIEQIPSVKTKNPEQ